MAEIKYTARMALTDILALPDLPERIETWAEGEIAKLDAKNDKRKNTKSKEQVANDGIMNSIVEYIKTNGSQVASALASALGISTQKASALCKILVDGGELTVADKKVKGKGSVKEYSLAPTDEVDTDEVAE